MVNWKDPLVMAKEALDFNNVVHVFFGLYVWEIGSTVDFEISLIKGKRKFGWPLCAILGQKNLDGLLIDCTVPFFLCRYGMLWALIGLVISLNVSTEVNCGALYTFISVAGNTTIASASTSLMIRTIALWEWKKSVTITIIILSLGQWGILIRGMNIVHAVWSDSANSCVVDGANHLLLNLNYFYTMTFDFVILSFTTAILGRYTLQRGGLSGLLFRDGLIYFLVTSMCNTIPAVLNLLNLNDEMNVIATIPAATTSAIAACRAVIRLKEYSERSQHYSLPTLNIISTITNRYRKTSEFAQMGQTDTTSFDVGTDSVPDPSAAKLPTYVRWTQVDGTVHTKTEMDPIPIKRDPIQSAV